mgnify:CR=1 FL=1
MLFNGRNLKQVDKTIAVVFLHIFINLKKKHKKSPQIHEDFRF